jgi:hypothetical protein
MQRTVLLSAVLRLGCPRKCAFDFRRNTEFFEKLTEFRGIFCSKITKNTVSSRGRVSSSVRKPLYVSFWRYTEFHT